MKSIILAIIAAIILASLLICAAACNWLGLSLQNAIRPLEAITLVVNLLIAFFLQRFFTTRINDLRAEKNVLIATCTEIVRLLRALRDRTDPQLMASSIKAEDRLAIISGFRQIANAITDLEESIEMSHLKSVAASFSHIWTDFYTLKMVTTGGRFPSRGYSAQQHGDQDRLFRSLTKKCQLLIFSINDARN